MAAPASAVTALATRAKAAVEKDLIHLNGRVYRQVSVGEGKAKQTFLEPVEVDIGLNPLNLLLGAAAGAVGAFFLFGRIRIKPPLSDEVELYKGPLADEWDEWKGKRTEDRDRRKECEALGGIWDSKTGICTIPSTLSCEDLKALYAQARAARNYTDARRYALQMQERGCSP